MGAHWSFGPVLQRYRARRKPDAATPPSSGREDVIPLLVEGDPDVSPEGIRFYFPSYNPSTQQAPAETRVYFQPDGATEPSTPEEFVARGYPYASATTPVGEGGAPNYIVPHPADLPEGEYIARTLCYFAE